MAVPKVKSLRELPDKILQQERQVFAAAGNSLVSAVEEQDEEDLHPWATCGKSLHGSQWLRESCRTGDGGSPLDRTRCSLRAAALSRSVSLLRMHLARKSLAEEYEASSLQ